MRWIRGALFACLVASWVLACGRVGFDLSDLAIENGDDAGQIDAGQLDRGEPVGSPLDSGLAVDGGDSGQLDSGPDMDAGSTDSGLDSGGPDSGAGGPDSAGSDAGGSGRVAGAIALYQFDEGSGAQVSDQSAVGAPLDLTIQAGGNTRWVSGALAIDGPSLITHAGDAAKVIDACRASDAMSVEAWVVPSPVRQRGPARIVALSTSQTDLNFMLAHGDDDNQFVDAAQFVFRVRASSNPAATPGLVTGDGSVTTKLYHLVSTYQAGERRLYVDNVLLEDAAFAGGFSDWATSHVLSLGNSPNEVRPWLGTLHLVAVYDRALSPQEVQQNFEAGPDP